MSDGLPGLLPEDPQNLLSVEARKRIQRIHVESEKYIWKAEVLIEKLNLENRTGHKATLLRNEAHFNKAKAVLSVFRAEFSQLDITDSQYREIMFEEIEAASNSLQLTAVQRRLLETEFYFPETKNQWPPPASIPIIPALHIPKPATIGSQIAALCEECRLTEEELAHEIRIDVRSVQRHIADVHTPHNRHLRAYERIFSKRLNRQIVISKTS